MPLPPMMSRIAVLVNWAPSYSTPHGTVVSSVLPVTSNVYVVCTVPPAEGVVSGHRWSSVVTGGHQWTPVVISGHQWSVGPMVLCSSHKMD